jgi:primase-polymerase (primpol)-like protein
MNLDHKFTCPEALIAFQEIPRWVNWGIDDDNPKRPHTPGNGSLFPASTTDPSTWKTYADAKASAEQHDCGIGLVLSPHDDDFDLAAFDLDKCRNPKTGKLAPWSEELVEQAGSYTEITPSGTGLRIIGIGSDVELHCDLPRDGDGHLEVYSQTNRFITVTGMSTAE